MSEVEYGWRSEHGMAYIGSRENVIGWAAGLTDHIVALVPLADYDRMAGENWQDDCECGHARWQHRPKCGAWPVEETCGCGEFQWVKTATLDARFHH